MAGGDPIAEVEALDEELLDHVNRASDLLARGEVEVAAAAMARARQLAPSDARVLGLLGQALYRLGRFDEAAEAYQGLADASPREPGARVNLGLARLRARRYPEAIRELERALELQPDHERALGYLGLAWLEQGEARRAREWFVRAGSELMVARCDELLARTDARTADEGSDAERNGPVAPPCRVPAVAEVATRGAGRFVLARDVLVTWVDGEVLVRAGGLVAVHGDVRLTPAARQQRGQPGGGFGEGSRRVLRARGHGSLVHALGARQVARLELDGVRPACVRDAVLFAFDGALAYENGRVASRLGSDLEVVQLRGRGEALVIAEHEIVSIAVTPAAPVRVRLAALAGWIGAVVPHFGPLVEAAGPGGDAEPLAVELSGSGIALVEAAR